MGVTKDYKGIFCLLSELLAEKVKSKNITLHALKKPRIAKSGATKSQIRGRGMDYFESRSYVPQDEIRHIDWKVSARLNSTFTKVFLEERERPVFILVDQRPSMFFGTKTQFKSVLAARIASFLAFVAINGLDNLHGLILTDTGIKRTKHGHLKKNILSFLSLLAQCSKDLLDLKNTDNNANNIWSSSLAFLNKHVPSGSIVFIISDFKDLSFNDSSYFYRLKKRCNVYPILIQDPLEIELPDIGLIGVSYNLEEQIINSSNNNIRKKFANIMQANLKEINNFFNSLNINLYRVSTNEDYLKKLNFLQNLR